MILDVRNRQRRFRLSIPRIRSRARKALAILAPRLPRKLEEIDIHFVTPNCIGQLHKRFMNDPRPTDVITFHHGEIFVCPAIGEKQRKVTGLTLNDEVLTYIIHGLLHLCGWDDETDGEFVRMKREQEKILQRVRK